MIIELWVTLAVLAGALYLFVTEKLPVDVVALNSFALAKRGIKVLTVYDALNDNRNIESSVRSGHEAGMLERMIRFAIAQRWLMIALTLALVAVGVWSFTKLPIDATPDISLAIGWAS